jgi:hypothetical protein
MLADVTGAVRPLETLIKDGNLGDSDEREEARSSS